MTTSDWMAGAAVWFALALFVRELHAMMEYRALRRRIARAMWEPKANSRAERDRSTIERREPLR